MYKNPLNNGDISDYNSLKKQRDYGNIIKKYKKKLPTEPTELQKYYQYLTYQQPILDEANYVAERMRTEDINKQKENFNFIEDLKIKREEEMKKKSQLEKDMNNYIRSELFDNASTIKNDDPTPTITTDIEMTIENIPTSTKMEIQNDLFDNPFDNSIPIKEEIFELSRTEEKVSKAKKKRQGRKKAKEVLVEQKQKANEVLVKQEQSLLKIENAILSKVKRERAKKELEQLKNNKEELISAADTIPIVKKKPGRPKGSTKKKIKI